MKTTIKVAVVLAFTALGFYLGIWLMLIGGIIQVVEAVKLDDIPELDIAVGLVKFFFGTTVFLFCSAFGFGLTQGK
jgi:hypothetical protein